jgi:protein-L-isoaspartate(D-aspartate) O-methyltransferase
MTNFAAQRAHMVHSQLMPNTVTDPRLLAAMGEVPREMFVPPTHRAVAYADRPLPLGAGRFLLDAMTLARLIQLAEIGAGDRVLIVGGATGYSAAIVARLAGQVFMIDENADLAASAAANLADAKRGNVAVEVAPHAKGLPAKAPFDAIIVEGGVPSAPQALIDQLKEGGRLAAIVGDDAAAKAVVFLRSDGTIGERQAFDAPAPALPGFTTMRTEFVF